MKTKMKIPLPLSLAERDRRWEIARIIMRKNQLDTLIIYGDRESATPAPFCIDHYFTNDRLGSVVIFHQEEKPIVITFASMMIADHMQASVRGDLQWIEPAQIYVGKTGTNIGNMLKEIGISDSPKIGIIGLEPYPPFYFDGALPHRTWKGITEVFPDAEIIPVYKDFFNLTASKSEEELRLITHAAYIGEAMSEVMRVTVKPGVSEAEIAAAITSTCIAMGGFTGEILMGSGPEYIGWGLLPGNIDLRHPELFRKEILFWQKYLRYMECMKHNIRLQWQLEIFIQIWNMRLV